MRFLLTDHEVLAHEVWRLDAVVHLSVGAAAEEDGVDGALVDVKHDVGDDPRADADQDHRYGDVADVHAPLRGERTTHVADFHRQH